MTAETSVTDLKKATMVMSWQPSQADGTITLGGKEPPQLLPRGVSADVSADVTADVSADVQQTFQRALRLRFWRTGEVVVA